MTVGNNSGSKPDVLGGQCEQPYSDKTGVD